MIKRIYLDLDGVMAETILALLRLYGLDVGKYEYDKYEPRGCYNLMDAYHTMGGDMFQYDRTDPEDKNRAYKEFWHNAPADIWADAPVTEEFEMVLTRCVEAVGYDNILIATSPTMDPEQHAAKYAWIESRLPRELRRQYSITPRKWMHGYDPHGLLIDDHDTNCDMFRQANEQVGGQGRALLFPRPWNRNHGHCASDWFPNAFDRLLWSRV